jgi:type VI protein secretion system component Hcp
MVHRILKEDVMDDTKKQPEETKDVPLPESELDKVAGGDKPQVVHHDFSITKNVDVASPKLYE